MTTFYIEQFGCRATQADGAAIERQLLERGCVAARDAFAAEVVVLNTCTVTAAADAQARDAIRRIHARNPEARIIATGCYAQRAPEDLAALPGVRWVVGNSHKAQIPDLIRDRRHSSGPPDFVPLASIASEPGSQVRERKIEGIARPQVLLGDIFEQQQFFSTPLGPETGHTRPTLKIQDGCNLRCAYCVIPFVRGRSRSLPPAEVVREIRKLVESGAREIVLSGINLGTWGRDLVPRVELLTLLRRILDETPLARLRLSSIEPQDVTRDLLDLFAATDRLADHFHMPLQSGSDAVLAAMHRRYRTAHYARRVELIRERLPHAAVGADVIAGFPGETDRDHSSTLDFIESLPFAYLHVFSYSERPGTGAQALSGQVSGALVKSRARQLRAQGESKAAAFRESQVGRTLRVLTLSRHGAGGEATPAVSSNYLKLRIAGRFPANLWMDVETVRPDGDELLCVPVRTEADVCRFESCSPKFAEPKARNALGATCSVYAKQLAHFFDRKELFWHALDSAAKSFSAWIRKYQIFG